MMRPGAVVLPFVALLSACPPTTEPPPPPSNPVRMVVEQRDPVRLAIGETKTFTVKVTSPSGGAPPKYVFGPGVSDPDFAFAWSVTKTGSGTETVTVTGQNYANPYFFLSLNVCPDKPYPSQDTECDWLKLPVTVSGGAPASLTLPTTATSMRVGERRRLGAWVLSVPRVTPNYPTVESRSHVLPTWSSSQPSVVSVTPDGAIEARSAGTAKLTATAGSASRSLDVTVTAGSLGPPPDGVTALFGGTSQFVPKVGAFDDRGYPFAAGALNAERGDAFFYPWLAEWTGSGWGVSLITPPDHPGTVEALVLENGRVFVLLRTMYGLELMHRAAADPHAAWATLPLDRLSGLHPELDPSVLKDRFELMYLEAETPFTGLDALEQDGGLFLVAGSSETNTNFPWPFQCVENVRLFAIFDGGISSLDVMSQRHHIGLGNPAPSVNDACIGPLVPTGTLSLLPRLPAESFPRVLYGAAPDEVSVSSGPPNRIPTLDGARYGSLEGVQEFIPRTGRWAHRALIPDAGIDVGSGRVVTSIPEAAPLRGSPLDPTGIAAIVPDPFLGGSARLLRPMLRLASGDWQPTPAEPTDDWMDPFINLGRAHFDGQPSRWGRQLSFAGGFSVTTLPRRQPLFTDPLDRLSGQRLGDTTKTDVPLLEPLFTASGHTLVLSTSLLGNAVYAASPAMTRLQRTTRNTMQSPRVAFTVGNSLFLFDGQQLARSDDLGATVQVVRTFSDTMRPKQLAAHASGAVFFQDVATEVFERRFSANLGGGAPVTAVPAPSAGALGGTLVTALLDESESVVRVLGSEFVVLTRVAVLASGNITKKLLVERFDLTGTRTAETVVPFSFPNPTQQLMFPGGVLLSPTQFATAGWTSTESQVVVFDLQTGATRTTSLSVGRIDTAFNQLSAVGRLLRTSSGALLWATVERMPVEGVTPAVERLHPVYRVSTDDGVTFGPARELSPPAAQAKLPAWGLNPNTGQLVTLIADTYVDKHFGESATYDDARFVTSVRVQAP